MVAIKLTEWVGTSANDVGTTAGAFSITYALGGDDHFTTNTKADFTVISGGPGNDTYTINGVATIVDAGGGYDIVNLPGLSLNSKTTYIATIDNRSHLLAWDTMTGTVVYVLNWLAPINLIEEFRLADSTVTTSDIANVIFNSPSAIPDFSWENVDDIGFVPFATGLINETISTYMAHGAYYALQAEAQGVGRLYEAGLNRQADIGGLNYWYDVYMSGVSKFDLSRAFIESAEFQRAFGNAYTQSAHDYIDILYVNVLGRKSDGAGAAYWENLLNNGMSREDALIAFADSAENMAQSAYLKTLIDHTGEGWWTFG